MNHASIPMPLLTIRQHSHGKAIRLAVLFALGLGLWTVPCHAQSRIAADEMAKRKAMVEEARELVAQGDQAMAQERPDQAVEAYAGAHDLLPDVPALRELRAAAIERYVAAALSQSAALANRGDLEAAKRMLEQVLVRDVAPDHPDVLKMKAMLNDPVRVNPALTPKHHDNVEEVVKLLQKANGAISLGRFDLAEQTFNKILLIDPYNVTARRGLEEVIKFKAQASKAGYDHARAELLLQVEKEWELSPSAPEEPASGLVTGNDPKDLEALSLEAKMRQIVIPRISLDDVTLRDAVEFLRVASAREDLITVDQSQRGINFAINLGPEESPLVQRIENERFDLKLANVPVEQVLKYIGEITGTSHVVDGHAVVIRPRGKTSDEMFVREYPVPPDFISALSEGASGQQESNPFDTAPTNQGLITQRLSVQELLKRNGVTFAQGASASYSAATNRLRVVNTADNHSVIEQIVELVRDSDPVVVSVQVTMIQAQQRDLEELGFDWLLNPLDLGESVFLGGGTTGNSGGRTVGDFSGTLPLPGSSDALVESRVVTNGLRSGDRGFLADSIDEIINNPARQVQSPRVAPGILSLTGIFTEGQAQLMMRGLSQKTGVDVMARPSVITRNAESAKILLAREFIYPTEYDPPELQQGGGNQNSGGQSFPVVPANPTAFEMREVGISLEVLPVAGEDKNYISVMLNPQIVEFDGFVNYGSPITVPIQDTLGNISRQVLTNNEILMPVFSTKRATTQLTVADGATVAFGGLLTQGIQSIEDKVPVLGDIPLMGRLFRSESRLPISTAIVFLVRVELMDPTGRRYRDINTP